MKLPLIIPVENQVRELDPKLLLACIAARRGFTSIIGSHRKIDFRIASLPRSLYLCKSFTIKNLHMFRIMHGLGQAILSWDEEALVHLPDAMYFSRRLSPLSLRYVSHLFAWGKDNAHMWRRYCDMPDDVPIHITGNPRADLLRPDIRNFYRDDVEALREKYGRFILVNTNFNHVNAFYPSQNLFRPARRRGRRVRFGKAARGMSLAFAHALQEHKQALFEHFKDMLPCLHDDFPGYNIIVRPHPTESPLIYQRIAAGHPRMHVSNDGNVVPWLMAASALVHNGCTTAIEAYCLGLPSISYRASIHDEIDNAFYGLPNQLSRQCFTLEEVVQSLKEMLCGNHGTSTSSKCDALLDQHLAARDGPLACERVVDVLDRVCRDWQSLPQPSLLRRLAGVSLANGRHLLKRLMRYLPGKHAPPEFHRHRYPGITLGELRERIARFQDTLGDDTELKTEEVYDQIFRIST